MDLEDKRDGVSGLVEALLEGKPPPPRWIERWSGGGQDPVQAAWSESDSYLMMLQLLCHRWPAFEASATRAVEAAVRSVGRPPANVYARGSF